MVTWSCHFLEPHWNSSDTSWYLVTGSALEAPVILSELQRFSWWSVLKQELRGETRELRRRLDSLEVTTGSEEKGMKHFICVTEIHFTFVKLRLCWNFGPCDWHLASSLRWTRCSQLHYQASPPEHPDARCNPWNLLTFLEIKMGTHSTLEALKRAWMRTDYGSQNRAIWFCRSATDQSLGELLDYTGAWVT